MDEIRSRQKEVLGGIWLVGLGILFASGAWWPGIMFLISATAIAEGYFEGQPWYGLQAGWWSAFVGAWALFRFNIVFLFVALGIGMILGAVIRPSPFAKPKPIVDDTLE